MSVNLSIKDVPEAIAERLRARAARNHRSLQRELRVIVERAAVEAAEPAASTPVSSGAAPERPSTIVFTRRGTKSIEQIAAEHRRLYPRPFADLPRAVDIVREDRDER